MTIIWYIYDLVEEPSLSYGDAKSIMKRIVVSRRDKWNVSFHCGIRIEISTWSFSKFPASSKEREYNSIGSRISVQKYSLMTGITYYTCVIY